MRWDSFLIGASPLQGYTVKMVPKGEDDDSPERRAFGTLPPKERQFNPWPDHNVYLDAKQTSVLEEWVHATFDATVAERVIRFARTKDTKELATLTDKERAQTLNKLDELRIYHPGSGVGA